jgi:hypothetical protein
MNDTQIVFPLSEIQSEFLQRRNDKATELVQDAVRLVAIACNIPVGIEVAPNADLTALVVVQQRPQQPPQPPNFPVPVPAPTGDSAPHTPDTEDLKAVREAAEWTEEDAQDSPESNPGQDFQDAVDRAASATDEGEST